MVRARRSVQSRAPSRNSPINSQDLSGSCISLAMDCMKCVSPTIVEMQNDCRLATLSLVLICQGRTIPDQSLAIRGTRRRFPPRNDALRKALITIDAVAILTCTDTTLADHRTQASPEVGHLPSVWRAAELSLLWYQDRLMEWLEIVRRFRRFSYPQITYLENFTVKGLCTKVKFSRGSVESRLCVEFANGTVRSFFQLQHGAKELYSLAFLSFTRWLEVMVYGWSYDEIGLLEIQRNSTGFVTGVLWQCERSNKPFWFPNLKTPERRLELFVPPKYRPPPCYEHDASNIWLPEDKSDSSSGTARAMKELDGNILREKSRRRRFLGKHVR